MATLIITEKPSSAEKIASALSEGRIEKKASLGAYYYIIERGGKELVVAPAVGHLFVLGEKKKAGWTYPVFSAEWKPAYASKAAPWSKKYFKNLEKVSKKASGFISACDYDIEGSTIAWNIIRFICKAKDGKRMKFSTLTKEDLVKAYEEASPHLDFENIEAGLARHKMDFLWGINTSRALTLSLKEAGSFKILSTGRVQGPTLHALNEREREIKSFVPVPYWELELTGIVSGEELKASHVQGKFWKKNEAKTIHSKCKGKDGAVESLEKKQYEQKPPFPFDLTTMQREAYKNFSYSPKQTLDIAQALYEQALISYPRTSSQKLPAKLGLKGIIQKLKKQKAYSAHCSKLLEKSLKPNEGPKKDSAHPSIFPTGATPKSLQPAQKKLYDLIVKRFLSVFAQPALRERAKAVIAVEGEHFQTEGFRTLQPEWIEIYSPYAKFKEVLLPPLKEGERVQNKELDLLDKQTTPPSRYTQATVLKEMEKLGLGTKSTRSNIIQTLYDRGYIEDKSIVVTTLGSSVIEALEKHCKEIVSIDLTRHFENEMEAIHQGRKKKEEIIAEAEKRLKKTLKEFKKHEKGIGKTLQEGLKEVLKADSTIGPCSCGSSLIKRRSRAGKPFVGCTGYPKCRETFSLPHNGSIKPQKVKCKCGLFILSVKRAGKRPWNLCVRCGFIQKLPKKDI